jgi:large repetitive protein
VTFTGAPKKVKTKKRKAKVSISFSSEAGASFECALDQSVFAPCTSPFSVSAKAKKGKGAAHKIYVRATDAAGNLGAVAETSFKVVQKKAKKKK